MALVTLPAVVELAVRQLAAYNAADLDAFCACYHPDVVALDADGVVSFQGIDAFRERYRPMFERGNFGASVDSRVHAGAHCVDSERFWRVSVDGVRTEGALLVRYTERDGTIAVVQFLR